jgi:hypothetical protein
VWGRGEVHTRFLVVKQERRRPLLRPRRKWKDIIKIHLREVRWGMDRIDLAQDKGHVAGSCE